MPNTIASNPIFIILTSAGVSAVVSGLFSWGVVFWETRKELKLSAIDKKQDSYEKLFKKIVYTAYIVKKSTSTPTESASQKEQEQEIIDMESAILLYASTSLLEAYSQFQYLTFLQGAVDDKQYLLALLSTLEEARKELGLVKDKKNDIDSIHKLLLPDSYTEQTKCQKG